MRLKMRKYRSFGLFKKYYWQYFSMPGKKLILGIGLTVFTLSTQQAQDFKFGVKAGINFATDTGDGEFDTGATARTGIHFGGIARMGIHERLGLQGEILYSMQGFKDEVTHKLDYINLPIVINYFPLKSLGLQAGPQFGFNINDTFDDEGSSSGSLGVKGFDVSLVFGAQYKFPTGLFAQGRYQMGLTDFIDYNTPSKNNVLSFSIGYFF